MTTRLIVRTDPGFGSQWWLRVAVHDEVAQLRTAAVRLTGDSADGWAEALGCFHSDSSERNYLGLMRLAYGHLSPEIVIHESVHAAACLTRKHYDCDPLRLGQRITAREELLAHSVHHISTALLRALL